MSYWLHHTSHVEYLTVLEHEEVNILFLDILMASHCSPNKDLIIKVVKCLYDLLSTILTHILSFLFCFQILSLPECLKYAFCNISTFVTDPKHGFTFMLSLNICAPLGPLLEHLYLISFFSIYILSFPLLRFSEV